VPALAGALPVASTGARERAGAARARYRETFHPDVVTRQLLAVYRSLRHPAPEHHH